MDISLCLNSSKYKSKSPRLIKAFCSIVVSLCIILFAGCATYRLLPGQVAKVIAEDEHHRLVRLLPEKDLNTLAEQVYGDAKYAPWLAQYNEVIGHQDLPVSKNWLAVTGGRYWAIPNGGPAALVRESPQLSNVTIFCYHRFSKKQRTKMMVNTADFQRQLVYLKQEGFNVLPLRGLKERLEKSAYIEPKSVVLTVDDGYQSFYEHAFPVIKAFGYPVTLFVYTDFLNNGGLKWTQLKEMLETGLVDIQPHSKTHDNLVMLNPGEKQADYKKRIQRELFEPKAVLKKRLGINAESFAYPYGDVNEQVFSLMKSAGYEMGLTVVKGENTRFTHPFLLHRNLVYGNQKWDTFVAALPSSTFQSSVKPSSQPQGRAVSLSIEKYQSAVCQKSTTAFKSGKYVNAKKWAKICLLLDPGHKVVYQNLNQIKARRPIALKANIKQANQALKSGNMSEARHLALEALALQPYSESAQTLLRQVEKKVTQKTVKDKFSRPAYVALFQKLKARDKKLASETAESNTPNQQSNESNQAANSQPASNTGDHLKQLELFRTQIKSFERLLSSSELDQAEEALFYAYQAANSHFPQMQIQLDAHRQTLADRYYARGIRYYHSNINEAVTAWGKALAHDPNHVKALHHYKKALVLQKRLKSMK